MKTSLDPFMTWSSRKTLKIPVTIEVPTETTDVLVASTSGANHTIYTVPQDGFYKVTVSGGGGGGAYKNGKQNYSGTTTQIVYLFKGTKCLLWSGARGGGGETSGTLGATGYPVPTTDWGGSGADYTSGESGGSGGGAAANGTYGTYQGGHGGGGSGFLAGTNFKITSYSHKEDAWSKTLTSTDPWTVGDFSVLHLYSIILGAGAGGNCSNSGSYRAGGGGGGAFGNGGYSYDWAGVSGPGGSWGQGAQGQRYGSGASGAWAIMDFSRNQFSWGQGGRAALDSDGYCQLYYMQPPG